MVYIVLHKNFYHAQVFKSEKESYDYLIDQFSLYLKQLGEKVLFDTFTFGEFILEEYEVRKFKNIDPKKTIYLIQDASFKVCGDILTNDIEVWKKQVSNNSKTYLELCSINLN